MLRYLSDELRTEEEEEFRLWLKANPEQQQFVARLSREQGMEAELQFMSTTDQEQAWTALQAQLGIPQQEKSLSKVFHLWKRMLAVAAVFLILMSTGFYFYSKFNDQPELSIHDLAKEDIKAGGNKAYLTLSNGKKIVLTDLENGKVAEQSGMSITKMADGKLLYELKESEEDSQKNNGEILYNTISTPAGGQYQVILPDGSRVWLNAASSLKYATSMAKQLKERRVELTGEAYFEVSKTENGKQKKPFIVASGNQEVEVLGTHFNINSYEPNQTATTLLEGKVKVNRPGVFEKVIAPGEQSLVGKGIEVHSVDTTTVIAWKNGLFKFENANIYTVMNQFSRWYNFEVAYEGKVPVNRFNGEIYRNLNASKALKILSYAKIKFRVEVDKNEPERKRIVITSN